MQTLVESGEVQIGVQWEGECYLQMDKGIPVDNFIWQHQKPLLTQTHTVSKYSDPVQKKLALAYVNEKLDPKFMNKAGETFYLRPTIKNAELPEGDKRRKYKYRLVFSGDRVVDQSWEKAHMERYGRQRIQILVVRLRSKATR